VVLFVGKLMFTVGFFERPTVALGVAPWGRVPATATGKLLLVENNKYANAVPAEKRTPTIIDAMMTLSPATRRR
jgi:hypothetical protein